MCGFVGLAWGIGREAPDRRSVDRGAASISHRGPDSQGTVAASYAHAEFRRLAVVDLENGEQPMSDESNRIQVFLNGEIYNHNELRRLLERRGHRLMTRSDAEVLPHLWEEFGPEMFSMLNGMFAICIVDDRSNEVILARDRLGVKPLFYAETDRGVVFGSELKAVLATGLVEREVDPAGVLQVLNSLSPGGSRTLIRGVQRVLPGELLRVDASGSPHLLTWYDLADQLEGQSAGATPDEVISLLRDSVALRLRADVPVGISLSGGIDSSLLALFAREAGHDQVIAFTVDFASAPEIELESAKAVAAHLGLEHMVVRSTTADYVEAAPLAVWTSDEPIADPVYFSALKVAEAASEAVTVLLAGTGADELFAGYGHHSLSRRRRVLSRMPKLSRALNGLPGPGLGLGRDELDALVRYRSDRSMWHENAMTHLTRVEGNDLARRLGFTQSQDDRIPAAYQRWVQGPAERQQLFVDTVTYLPDQLLPLLDRTTMAYSIEGRVPYLDHRVVEAALRMRYSDGRSAEQPSKRLLRETLRGKVPSLVLERPKLGFPNAVEDWLRGELGDLVPIIVNDPAGLVRQFFPTDFIRALTDSKSAMLARWPLVNALLVLQIWHRIFVIEAASSAPTASLRDIYGNRPNRSRV